MTVGEKWRAAREAAGMSVQQAADATGLHRNTIYDLEKDDEGVTLRVMNRVAASYGTTLSAIFRDDTLRAEHLPSEFRPLLEPLAPLDRPAREAIIRNIASNLRFMWMMAPRGDENVNSTKPMGSKADNSVTTSHRESNERDDVLADVALPQGSMSQGPHGQDHPAKRRGHGSTTGKRSETKGQAD